jgi:hypothetical protein
VLRPGIARQATRIAALEEYVALSKFRKYTARSKKFSDQQEMFNEVELTVVAEEMLAGSAQNQHLIPTQLKSRAASSYLHTCPACVLNTIFLNLKNSASAVAL